jgi:hypothetical protein
MAVLVLGMHRSGTSLVAEMLGKFGLYLGPADQLIGSSSFNARGHFELLRAVEFDNAVLQQAGGTWDAPPPVESIEALGASLQPAVDEWFGHHDAWAFKDPRLCLTLPVWMPALSRIDVRVVHVLRDPYAVARSLVARNAMLDLPAARFAKGQMTMADALNLWAEYNRRASVCTEAFGLSRLVLWYDHVLDAPGSEVARLAEFLGRGDEGVATAAACVFPEFRHHRHA